MAEDLHKVFDFLIADDGDMMLLVHKIDGEPKTPAFEVDKKEKTLCLYRSRNSTVELQEIDEKIIDKLLNMPKLLVCEMNAPAVEENSEPEYVYEAVRI